MIVSMKKAYIVMQAKDLVKGTKGLQDLGLVHIEHLTDIPDSHASDLKEEIENLEKTLEAVKPFSDVDQKAISSWEDKQEELRDHIDEKETLEEAISRRQVRIDRWVKWGDFNPEDVDFLKENNIYLKLYEVPVAQFGEKQEGVIINEIYRESGVVRCVAIAHADFELPFAEVDLPQTSIALKQQRNDRDQKQLDDIKKSFQEAGQYYQSLSKELQFKKEQLELSLVQAGVGEEENLAYLKGFLPTQKSALLQQAATQHGWGISIDDPSEDDIVPTLLENSAVGQLSKPAFDVIEIIPGYREFDVSNVFLVFFTLFFAMLVGDAAYGLIFAGLTFFAHIKLKDKVKDQTPFRLMYLLTFSTMVWGVLTGTYFGQAWLPSTVKAVVPWLNDPANIQWLCFTVAFVHLSVARLWSMVKKFPSLQFLAELGWFFIVWGMYHLANQFVLNQPMPSFAPWLILAGSSLALLFMVPFKEFFKKVPQELIPFVLGIIGAGTDIISYIRLFAVGLATVAVADAANAMPEALPGVGYVLMVFLHALNLVLAAMAILVHAIRLNVLEFSGHLGLEWSGVKYNPFSSQEKAA